MAIADSLNIPAIIVHSEVAAIAQDAKEFYRRLPGEQEQL